MKSHCQPVMFSRLTVEERSEKEVIAPKHTVSKLNSALGEENIDIGCKVID